MRAGPDVTVVEGDVTDPASLGGVADGCDAVIHLVGVIDEQPARRYLRSHPLPLARLGVYTVGRVGLLPISPVQFEMLIEGNTGDASAFHNTFPFTPAPFSPRTLSYLEA